MSVRVCVWASKSVCVRPNSRGFQVFFVFFLCSCRLLYLTLSLFVVVVSVCVLICPVLLVSVSVFEAKLEIGEPRLRRDRGGRHFT